MSDAYETSFEEFLELDEFWEKFPPMHVVAASFVTKENKKSKKNENPKQTAKQLEMQQQTLAMDFPHESKAANHDPSRQAFLKSLEENGGDPSKMQKFFEENEKENRKLLIQRLREQEERKREKEKQLESGRPTW